MVLDLQVELAPYEGVVPGVWVRDNLRLNDARYVALVELLGAKLATVDSGLSRTPGHRCEFVLPPG